MCHLWLEMITWLPSLFIYGNLLIESVSSVFHFRRVPFFNGIKKKLYFSFESHFRRVPFFNGIKKKLYFSFESPWRISGSPNVEQRSLAIYCILARSMETSKLVSKCPCKARARKTPFQTKHAIQYGLSITARDPMSSEVVVVRCQFCICFGRKGSSKKSLTTWTFEGPPFRTDNYMQHLCLNHKTRWEEYQGLAHQEKSKYFDVAIKHAKTICHYIEPQSEAITLTVSNNIVDVVIGNMLWYPTDMEGQTRENALSLFKRKENSSYLVEITKSKQFLLATRYVRCGMSFAMVADVIHDVKEVCDIPKLGACSDYLVTSYAKVACALSIEHISQVLCSKWAFQWRLTRQPTFSKPLGLMFAFGTIRTLLWKTFIWLLSHLLVGTLAWPRLGCLKKCLTLSVLYGKTSWLVALRTG